MACSGAGSCYGARAVGVCAGAFAWWEGVCAFECARQVCDAVVLFDGGAGGLGGLSQAASGEGGAWAHQAGREDVAWDQREGVPAGCVGADVVWGHHGAGVLSGGSSGAVFGAFHHGQCVYCLWDSVDHPAAGWAVVAAQDGEESGVL